MGGGSGSLTVEPSQLGTHAAQIQTFMGQLEGATSEAGKTWDPRAFGMAGMYFAQILDIWVSSATSAIGSAVAAGHDVSQAVQQMAADYDAADQRASSYLEQAADGDNPLVSGDSSVPIGLTGFDSATAATEGSGLFSDAAQAITDHSAGWPTEALDLGSVGLDLLGFVADPFGSLIGAGIGWLIEHIGFLKDALDLVAGNPEEVTSKSETWTNIAKALQQSANDYTASTTALQASFQGAAASTYAQAAGNYQKAVAGAASHADAAAQAFQDAGIAVATVRGVIRDTLSQFAGDAIVKFIAAQALAIETLGASEGAFVIDEVAEGTSLAVSNAGKISKLISALKAFGKAGEDSATALKDGEKGLQGAKKAVKSAEDDAVAARQTARRANNAAKNAAKKGELGYKQAKDALAATAKAKKAITDAKKIAEDAGDTDTVNHLNNLAAKLGKNSGELGEQVNKVVEDYAEHLKDHGYEPLHKFLDSYHKVPDRVKTAIAEGSLAGGDVIDPDKDDEPPDSGPAYTDGGFVQTGSPSS